MERYQVIDANMPREFILLQGSGCRWRKCTFCDYHTDTSENPFTINKSVLDKVTGVHGVLDIINSGSFVELDPQTVAYIKKVVQDKKIHTLWFESHYMYRHHLKDFAAQFEPAVIKFRCGVESFDPALRNLWNKGIPNEVDAQEVAKYFNGVCLLCCTCGETKERIVSDLKTARQYFEYFSVNLFCNNSTSIKRDENLVKWFIDEVYPTLKNEPGIEVLINNTDLGVG